VENGIVQDANIYGDFFGVGDVAEIEQAITGVKYERASLDEAISGFDIPTYLGGITKEEFLKLIY
jgi:lipoate-protein ligase A